MTASARSSSKHHRIRSLEVTGGLLQGIKMDFSDGLNCVIGGRGTGKTRYWKHFASRSTGCRTRRWTANGMRRSRSSFRPHLGTGGIKLELDLVTGWTRKHRTHAYLSYDGNEGTLTPRKTLINIEKRGCTHFAEADLGDPVLVQL